MVIEVAVTAGLSFRGGLPARPKNLSARKTEHILLLRPQDEETDESLLGLTDTCCLHPDLCFH